MIPRTAGALLLLLATAACRGTPPGDAVDPSLAALVDSLRPSVESAAGFTFKAPPRAAVRSRDEVRAFLQRQLERELPPARRQGLVAAYTLLGLVPDTLKLDRLLLELYSQQVAGYYDHERGVLIGVEGADPDQLRVILSHELVHALQAQYVPLDSILGDRRDADRSAAAQAVLEGQATLIGLRALVADSIASAPGFWDTYAEQVRLARESAPGLRDAPRVLRMGVLFPYLQGASFVRWWGRTHPATEQPFGARMPRSTEQILHPDRYERGDAPITLAFEGAPGLLEDVLGEYEVSLLSDELAHTHIADTDFALGWGGDRYRIEETPDGPALVWVAVWDDALAADRFAKGAGAGLAALRRAGYRATFERFTLEGRPATRFIHAPAGWRGWTAPPVVKIAG